ncbi:DUF1360 domain-containing protein [Gottfriedia acidiceleris]|uniref:DUF1360 domain-containing protein n=1 Tax=Gottfriedia acidiceleris TaxID=371036 RepID=UPI002FFE42E3
MNEYGSDTLINISWIHLVILSLASFRLTHLMVFDTITWFLRKPFVSINTIVDASGRTITHMGIKGSGWRYWAGALLTCHWCMGVWCSLAVVALYYFLPIAFPLILILAIAGIASIIEFIIVKK